MVGLKAASLRPTLLGGSCGGPGGSIGQAALKTIRMYTTRFRSQKEGGPDGNDHEVLGSMGRGTGNVIV